MKVRLRVDAPGNPQAVRFLHVLQGADAGASADAATAIKSDDGAFEGAVVRDTAVLFPVTAGAAVAQIAYVAPAGVTRHLVTGLTPGVAYTAQTAAVAGGTRVTLRPGGTQRADGGGVLLIGDSKAAAAVVYLPTATR
jgi:hypothetical protein